VIEAHVGEERGAGRPSEAVEAVTVGGFLSWPSVLLCLALSWSSVVARCGCGQSLSWGGGCVSLS
jgi:hypothetical protein